MLSAQDHTSVLLSRKITLLFVDAVHPYRTSVCNNMDSSHKTNHSSSVLVFLVF